jgi:phospholipid/cholesterol/gamma-HCH transport system substrate-binding protein
MTARRLGAALLAVLAVVVLAIVVAGGGDDQRYTVRLELDNALGLRDGSLVTVGGVEVGKVRVRLDHGRGDEVEVEARLDAGQGPIGRGARAYITSVNLLGQKRLELDKGNPSAPLPSGSLIASSRVTPSTDLDQVLAVLTPDVRSRLGILLNEAGAGVVGRSADISKLIRTLPSTIDKATKVIDGVVTDNHTLADLVDHSDQLVTSVAAERAALGDLVDSAGQAAGSAADKRAQLRATLVSAPGMLGSLRRFLGRLQTTTVPLGPAARDITAVAPALLETVDELAPFQKAASPTLAKAVDVAPALTKLAAGATPVLRSATPTVGRAAQLASDLVPVTDTLDRSVDNLIGTVDNWSRAVQYRDGLSHIFRGEAAVTPQTLEGLLIRYLGAPTKAKAKTTRPKGGKGTTDKAPSTGAPSPSAPAPPGKPRLPDLLPKVAQPLQKALDGLLGGLTGKQQAPPAPAPANPAASLLDFLLKP